MKNEPIRVLHITEMLSAAGIESFIMNVYRNIDRERVQFDFLVLRNEKEFYDDEILRLRGKKYFVYSKIKNTWLRVLDESRQIEVFLKDHNYKIVHIHYTTPLRAPYLLAAKRAGVPIRIYHAHSAAVSGKSKLKLYIYEYYRKKTMEWGTEWFACSKAAAKWIFPEELFGSGKVKIIYNGIDTNRFKYDKFKRNMIREQLGLNCAYTLINTGRFSEQKNQSFLLKVNKDLKQKCPNIKLLFLGEGKLQGEIKEKAKQMGVYTDILFLGVKKNVEDYLSAADFYVMPSRYDGLPVAAIEAQCSGLPSIMSTNITDEVALTDHIEFISLDEKISEWSNKILKYKNFLREDNSQIIAKNGYDIKTVAKWIEGYYESKANGE